MAERPEDLNLPTSVVGRIIKETLPSNVNVSKDARLALSKAASVFVLYATSCANNFAMQNKRKTINAQDVYEAMNEMEYAEFVEPLQQNLEAYKANQRDKKDLNEKKKKGGSGERSIELERVEETEEISEESEPEMES